MILNLRLNKKFFLAALSVVVFIAMFSGCADNPNDLGLIFVPASDTTATRFLDSEADTMNISTSVYRKYINTSVSQSFLIGNYQSYQSRAMLKYKDISTEYDSTEVSSAILTMRYSDYFFKDENGLTSFDIYTMNNSFNYSTVTSDSVTSVNYGTVSKGNYSGTPLDTQTINVTLDNDLVEDWLDYAADTTFANKNFGIIFVPDAGSSTIKGFYSNSNELELIPYVTAIFTKNGVVDTITLITSDFVTLSDAPSSIIPQERFILQNGIAYRTMMNFDLSKLPSNVVINNVTLQLSLDNPASFISGSTDKRLVLGTMIDSVNKTDSLYAEGFLSDSTTYSISSVQFNAIFQRWNSGILPYLGISIKNYFELQNLDCFVFYDPSSADISKRPRLKITYTPRQ